MLFGCPLELCNVGGLMKIPPVLEYLMDYTPHNRTQTDKLSVCQKYGNCNS
jgi:hypothetical protein